MVLRTGRLLGCGRLVDVEGGICRVVEVGLVRQPLLLIIWRYPKGLVYRVMTSRVLVWMWLGCCLCKRTLLYLYLVVL